VTEAAATPPQPAKSPIVFGTDGWRARIAEEFTFDNVRRCADGVARYVIGMGEQAKGVVIAYDRRIASEHFAQAAAEVILGPRSYEHTRGLK
jgi:phosphomannomutase